jgi:hypothetical protein
MNKELVFTFSFYHSQSFQFDNILADFVVTNEQRHDISHKLLLGLDVPGFAVFFLHFHPLKKLKDQQEIPMILHV